MVQLWVVGIIPAPSNAVVTIVLFCPSNRTSSLCWCCSISFPNDPPSGSSLEWWSGLPSLSPLQCFCHGWSSQRDILFSKACFNIYLYRFLNIYKGQCCPTWSTPSSWSTICVWSPSSTLSLSFSTNLLWASPWQCLREFWGECILHRDGLHSLFDLWLIRMPSQLVE